MTPPGHQALIHLSLTDELPYAQAFVVIEVVITTVGRDDLPPSS